MKTERLNAAQTPPDEPADKWWITGLPQDDVAQAGPYDTRAEADEDRVGMAKYFAHRAAGSLHKLMPLN